MAVKINFTEDHKKRLDELVLKMLYLGNTIKGFAGTEIDVFDLIHRTTIGTLQTTLSNLKKEVEKLENLDEWSLTSYQQKKLETTKDTVELVNLMIGYRKSEDQKASDAQTIKELKREMRILKTSQLSPEDQIKAMEEKIKAMGGNPTEEEEAE